MTNGTQAQEMYYTRAGNGPVVVLLHGFPDSGRIWSGVADDLKNSFTLLIPDLPGSGNSPLAAPTSLADMAAGIKQILDKEGITKAIIAGHSMGGYVALAFARLYPASVAGLSLIHSSPMADDDEKVKLRLKTIELIQMGGKESFIKQMTANLFAPGYTTAHPGVVAEKTAMGLSMSDEGMINFYRAMIHRDDNRAVVHEATYPVQWVLGSEDALIDYRKILKECHQSYINFVTLYIGCGHISTIGNPEMLVADLREFCNYCCPNRS